MDFTRPKQGFEYDFRGIKVNVVPNSMPPTKFPYAQNIRSNGGSSVKSRPGMALRFSAGAVPITDLRAYSTLGTDNLPRVLARDANNAIWLDNGVQVGSLAPGGLGATLVPFRPNASPQSYLYVAGSADYQKFSAPVANVVTASKAGIAEPQSAPEACPDFFYTQRLDNVAANFVNAGTAGALTDIVRSTESIVAMFADPASVPIPQPPGINLSSPRTSIQVGTTQKYQVGQTVTIAGGGGSIATQLQDVIPSTTSTTFTIQSIQYLAGATGRCVIVTTVIAAGDNTLKFDGNDPSQASFVQQIFQTSFRRGVLLRLAGGVAETVFVLDAILGPGGSICIETSTINTHAAGESLTIVPTLIADAPTNRAGQVISSAGIQSTVASGAGLITQALGTPSQFAQVLQAFSDTVGIATALLPRPQDYFHFSINVSDITLITSIRIAFDVNNGAADFTSNFYYFDVAPNDLVSAVAATQSQVGAAGVSLQRSITRTISLVAGQGDIPLPIGQGPLPVGFGSGGDQTTLGTSQWSEIAFPLTSLTRVGNDETRTLQNVQSMRVIVNATGSVTVQLSSFWIGGGGEPDTGITNAPYVYHVRPRSSVTGAIGNPSPKMRYGVSPRRQQVAVSLPSAAYDSQIDTWDIFRYGGTVTSWRYVGSAPSSAAVFYDNSFDDAAVAGDPLDFDNFEPWPSIDLPQSLVASTVVGTLLKITTSTSPNILRWLPGTLILLSGNQAYTLRKRPTLISGTTFLLELVENSGSGTNVPVIIQEPVVARQFLPYLFGPDVEGRMLAVGDPLRPGTLSFSKSNNPDSVPDTFNREIGSPSEPLLGGEIIDGRGFVASPERWWELIPQQSTDPTQFYNPVPSPIPRGLAAPFGHANDGTQIFFWAKDGIWSTSQGSLTDADLYNLFPHEDVPGQAVTYGGFTIQPPDYSRTGTFRLEHVNGFLYAIYQDSTATYRTLVLDLHRMAWSVDVYSPAVSAAYHPEQEAGTVLTSSARYDELLLGTVDGRVAARADLTNDLGVAIPCAIASFEFDGGDVRAPLQWGDFFVDLIPAAFGGVTFTPMSASVAIAAGQVIAQGASRLRNPVTVGGLLVSDFMGLLATWNEDFNQQSAATLLNLWQPSYDIQPAYGISWQTFGSGFGTGGFSHIPYLEIAWVSTTPITLTIVATDGTSPAPLTIPSSGGVYKRAFFRLTFNKGRLFSFKAASSAKFQFFMDDWVVPIGAWGRADTYAVHRDLGVPNVEQSPV